MEFNKINSEDIFTNKIDKSEKLEKNKNFFSDHLKANNLETFSKQLELSKIKDINENQFNQNKIENNDSVDKNNSSTLTNNKNENEFKNNLKDKEEQEEENYDNDEFNERHDKEELVKNENILENELNEIKERLFKLNFNLNLKDKSQTNLIKKDEDILNKKNESLVNKENLNLNKKDLDQNFDFDLKNDFIYKLIKKDLDKIEKKNYKDEFFDKEKSDLVKTIWNKQKWSLNHIVTFDASLEKSKLSKEFRDDKSFNFENEGNLKSKKKDNLKSFFSNTQNKQIQIENNQKDSNVNYTQIHNDSNQKSNLSNIINSKINKAENLNPPKQMYDELVEKARINMKSDGSSNASISMKPNGLGRLTLNLNVYDKEVNAQLIVENTDAKKIVLEELNNLKEELLKQGVKVQSFDIFIREKFEANFQENSNPEKNNTNNENYNTNFNQNEQNKNQNQFNQNLNNEELDNYLNSINSKFSKLENIEYEISQFKNMAFLEDGQIDLQI